MGDRYVPYRIEYFLAPPNAEVYPIPIMLYVERFLNRMQEDCYEDRPDSDQCLRFFISARNLCQLLGRSTECTDEVWAYSAKIVLLASGLWNTAIGIRSIYRCGEPLGGDIEEEMKTFEQYSFEDSPNIYQALCVLSQRELLTPLTAKALVQHCDDNYSEYLA